MLNIKIGVFRESLNIPAKSVIYKSCQLKNITEDAISCLLKQKYLPPTKTKKQQHRNHNTPVTKMLLHEKFKTNK